MPKKQEKKQMTSAGVKASQKCKFEDTFERDLIRLVGSKRGKVFYVENPNWNEAVPLLTDGYTGDGRRQIRPNQMVEVLNYSDLAKLWGIKGD